MVKKEEPDEDNANGSRYNSSYYTKPEQANEDFNENGQTDNYDEWKWIFGTDYTLFFFMHY